MKKLATLFCLSVMALSACHNSIKEREPSEAFRDALDEVMQRQPSANKINPDDIGRRREKIELLLSLDDCIELAMAHNRSILFEQLNAEVAGADVVGSKANLDFVVNAGVSYTREEQELQSRFFGDNRDEEINATTNYTIGANLPFATGTIVDVTGGFTRNDSNNPFQSFEFFPSATLTVTQHLLNGFGLVPNLGDSWIAENEQMIANWQVEVTRNDQALEVANAYWNLAEAQEELKVLIEQQELAVEALTLARRRLEAEIGTRLDVLTQESNLKTQEVSLIQARSLVGQRTDELLYAIHPDLLHGYVMFENYNVVIEPQTMPDTSRVTLDKPVLIEELKAALRRRPEIQQARKRIESAGIQIDMGEYGLLPTLDLDGHVTVRGFGEQADNSFDSFGEFKNLEYGFGLNFGVPIQNRAARATLTRAEIAKRNAILSARDTETNIILEVANAVRAINTSRESLAAAQEANRLQEETYEAEIERQNAGISTAFETKQALTDRTQANIDLVKAEIGLERARLQLQKATGELGR